MIKDYIKEFDTDSEYQSYITGDPVLPNVSYIIETNGVEYNPYVPPRPTLIITYTASAKLAEVTRDTATGLHINSFNTTIKSHTFENGVGTIEFNDDVTSIGYNTFSGCTDLTSINIPSSVTSIGKYAFDYCNSLTSIGSVGSGASVKIPDSVTSIGYGAFQNCKGLTSATITDGVTSISMYAFKGCSGLTSITIPDSVTSIGSDAFSDCTSLTNITCNATTAPTIQSFTFYNVKTNGTLTVPTGSTGYDTWMGSGNYYLGKYGWTKVEQ